MYIEDAVEDIRGIRKNIKDLKDLCVKEEDTAINRKIIESLNFLSESVVSLLQLDCNISEDDC